MEFITDLFSNLVFEGLFALVLAFVLSVKIHPVIICLEIEKNLMAEPGFRSSHSIKTPNLGGVGLFIVFSICILALASVFGLEQPEFKRLSIMLASTSIMFFLGVKDDLIGLSPKKKMIGQTIAAMLVILLTDVRIRSFEGIFGIHELPYIFSVVFTISIFIFLINSFNLIDGIDGLAGSISIISSLIFGLIFFQGGDHFLTLVSFILVGAMSGFLIYNFSEKRKLFMGDSGSLFVGFLLSFQAICFLNFHAIDKVNAVTWSNTPILILAILSFPVFDAFRVVIIRLYHRENPLAADRNHLHHRLIDLGLSHKMATLIIAGVNIMIIGLAFVLSSTSININIQLLILVVVVPGLGLLPDFISLRKGRQEFEYNG
jgi:UDP-N-acetylmuramyl pentapeptide phosphotransferase/UDP-N-acetylglucosamine-1-phosphate transferase